MLIDSQLTIFDIIREKYVLNTTKPIKLIELFAGYGSQALALKYLNIPFIHHKICEWAVPSIQAYKDLHFTDVDEDYTENLFEDQLDKILFEYGISSDYNKPMDLKQIQKRSFDWKRKVYNNIKTTHNLVNIMSVKGKDLDFNDNKNETIILTYSFPCQDLSLAGSRKGMSISQAEGELGTRSGLLWEVERILVERQRESLPLPNILLMENVPQVISKQNVDDFNKWQLRLEKLGYCNYHEILNAKDFGIPQNRERCFMISLLGNYNYKFPKKEKLKLKLKDLLEEKVDEKYYLSKEIIERISNWNSYQKPLECMKNNIELSPCITARGAGEEHSGMILIDENLISIKNNTKQGYLLAKEGDGIDISSRMEYHRGTVQKEKSQTITTQNNVGVVVKDKGNYIQWEQKGFLDIDCRAYKEDTVAPTTTTTAKSKVLLNNLRIRKLTPKECWRLMGVKDEDYEKAKINQSNSSLYHLAGDSIVANVLMEIFNQLL